MITSLKTGIRQATVDNMVFEVGVLLKNFNRANMTFDTATDVISATRGGATFAAVPTIRQIDVDGAPQNTKELQRVDDYVVTLTVTILEASLANVKLALGAASVASNAITGRRYLTSTDFGDIYFYGQRADGKLILITLKNVLNKNGFTLATANKNEGTIALTLTAHYGISDMDTPPFTIEEITIPA
jgi:hypothetical protein